MCFYQQSEAEPGRKPWVNMVGADKRWGSAIMGQKESLDPCRCPYEFRQLEDLIREPKGNECIIGFNPLRSRGIIGVESIVAFFHGDYQEAALFGQACFLQGKPAKDRISLDRYFRDPESGVLIAEHLIEKIGHMGPSNLRDEAQPANGVG